MLNVLSEYASLSNWGVVKRRAPRTDRPLMHFASPPDEKCGLRRAKASENPLEHSAETQQLLLAPQPVIIFNLHPASTYSPSIGGFQETYPAWLTLIIPSFFKPTFQA